MIPDLPVCYDALLGSGKGVARAEEVQKGEEGGVGQNWAEGAWKGEKGLESEEVRRGRRGPEASELGDVGKMGGGRVSLPWSWGSPSRGTGGTGGTRDVTAQFVQLTGPMAFGPRWSLGLALTAMALADAPDAGDRICRFLRDCKAWAVPCSAFHFGSGYTSIAGKRYVFHWNRCAPPPCFWMPLCFYVCLEVDTSDVFEICVVNCTAFMACVLYGLYCIRYLCASRTPGVKLVCMCAIRTVCVGMDRFLCLQ